MKLPVPFFSQLDKNVPEELKRSVCSIACIKMILDSDGIENDFNDLYKEAEFIGGRQKAGWNHETLVRILRNYGIPAYAQEFLAHSINLDVLAVASAPHSKAFEAAGLAKIKKVLDSGKPVIVSVHAGFSQDSEKKKSLNMTSHVVLIVGYDGESFYINDPILDGASVVSSDHLLRYWRMLAIFVE